MLRIRMLTLTAGLAAGLALAACHHEPVAPTTPHEGDYPPLPPASGTPIGYLVDNAAQLHLKDDQLARLKELDESLQARNDGIDTQLREIETPDEAPPEKGKPRPRYNNAPGMGAIKTTTDASKLHDAHNANNRDAIEKAFAILDPGQKTIARRLLDDRGIAAPAGSQASGNAAGSQQPAPKTEDDTGGVPVEP